MAHAWALDFSGILLYHAALGRSDNGYSYTSLQTVRSAAYFEIARTYSSRCRRSNFLLRVSAYGELNGFITMDRCAFSLEDTSGIQEHEIKTPYVGGSLAMVRAWKGRVLRFAAPAPTGPRGCRRVGPL